MDILKSKTPTVPHIRSITLDRWSVEPNAEKFYKSSQLRWVDYSILPHDMEHGRIDSAVIESTAAFSKKGRSNLSSFTRTLWEYAMYGSCNYYATPVGRSASKRRCMRSHHPMDAIVQKVPLKMIYACEYNASFHLSYSAGLLVRVAAGKVKAVIRPLTVPTTSICEVDLILEWSSGIPLSFFLSFFF